MHTMTLYHVGFQEIRQPDVHYGRTNADFGQGFYLSEHDGFAKRWARSRPGKDTYLNVYELSTDGLAIKRLIKDREWFDYIFANRAGKADALAGYDAIIEPIANDTIYNTWGLLTSGLVDTELALKALMIGPVYEQVVLKTERAAAALRFVSAQVIPPEVIAQCRESVKQEEDEFLEQFGALVEAISD